jgi:hypothetical protein
MRSSSLKSLLPLDPPDWNDWNDIFALLHGLWGDARGGIPYDRNQKRKWARLLEALELLAAQTRAQEGTASRSRRFTAS